MPGPARGRGRGFITGFAPGRGWQGARVPGRPDNVRDGPRDRPPLEPRARPRVAAWGLANGSGGAPQWKPPPEAEDANQQPLGARLGSGPHTPRDAPASSAQVHMLLTGSLCCSVSTAGQASLYLTCAWLVGFRLRRPRLWLLNGHVSCPWSWSAAPNGQLNNRCAHDQRMLQPGARSCLRDVLTGRWTLMYAEAAQDIIAPAAAQPVEYEAPGIAKRPAPADDDANPTAKKRARRLFGALMGTLAKARRVQLSSVT